MRCWGFLVPIASVASYHELSGFKNMILDFLLWVQWVKNMTSGAQVTGEVWVQSLAQELPYAMV